MKKHINLRIVLWVLYLSLFLTIAAIMVAAPEFLAGETTSLGEILCGANIGLGIANLGYAIFDTKHGGR